MCIKLISPTRELSELHKTTAVNKSVAHEALLSAEQTARQELTEALEKNRVESAREKEKLLLEVGRDRHVHVSSDEQYMCIIFMCTIYMYMYQCPYLAL